MLLDLGDDCLQPLLEIAAITGAGSRAPMSSAKMVAPSRLPGPRPRRSARPGPRRWRSCPTPGRRQGLFFDRRQRIWMVRSISISRPMTGSMALDRLVVRVDAVGLQRLAALLDDLLRRCVLVGARDPWARSAGRSWRCRRCSHRVEAGHVLLLQVIDRMALALGEQRHQHVGADHLLAAGGLHMDGGTLQHALEAGGRLGILDPAGDEVGEFIVEIGGRSVRSFSISTPQARITATAS